MLLLLGNSQGKYQHPDALPGYEHPYLLETLPGGFDFNVEQADVSVFEGNKFVLIFCLHCSNLFSMVPLVKI